MNSNNIRIKSRILPTYSLSARLRLPIHFGGINRYRSLKLISRYCPPRHLLRSSPLSLCLKNRGSIRYFRRIQPLLPPIYRTYNTAPMSKSTILNNIHWSKHNILPSTFFRPSRIPPTLLRLPRHLHYMKRNLINRIHSFIYSTSLLHLYSMRSPSISTAPNLYTTLSYFTRMTKRRLPS